MARHRRRRRRMNGCARCALKLVVVLVIFVAAIYGGGLFAWGRFAQPKVGITYNQALSLASGLYSGNENKIVAESARFTQKDLDNFYEGLETALFLDESVDIKSNFSKVILELINKKDETAQEGGEEASVQTVAAVENPEETTNTSSVTGNETLDEFLKSLKFDFSSLKTYDEENASPHVLQITGNQLAAFLNNALVNIVQSDLVKEKIPQEVGPISLSNVDLTKAVRIPQVVIKNKSFAAEEKVSLTMTVCIEMRGVAKQVLESINKSLGILSILVPKALFVTATIYPNDPTQPAEIDINAFNQSKKMDALVTLLDKIMLNTQYQSFEGLMQQINSIVNNALDKVGEVVPIYFVDSGCVEAKPINALMKTLKVTELTETQFFCMIRDICLPTFDDVKQSLYFPEAFKQEHIDPALELALDDLIREINDKYAIEDGYLQKDTLYQQLTKVDSNDPNEDTLKKHIKISELTVPDTFILEEAKLSMEYLAFAGLVNSYLKDNPVMNGEGDLNISFKVINMGYTSQASQQFLNIIAEVGLLDAIAEKIEPDSIAYSLASQLIPESMYFSAAIRLDADGAFFTINGLSIEETQQHLTTITTLCNSLGIDVSSFNYDELATKLSTNLKNSLEKISTELGSSIIFRTDAALLPSVYEVLANKVVYKEGDLENLTPQQIHSVLKEVKTMPEEYSEPNKVESLATFLENEVNTKYAINPLNKITEPQTEEDAKIIDQLTNLASTYDNVIVGSTLATAWKDGVATYGSAVDKKIKLVKEGFSPIATEGELAKLLSDSITIDAQDQGLKNIQLSSVFIIKENDSAPVLLRLILTAELDVTNANNYAQLVPDFVIRVDLDLDKVNTTDNCCTVTINNLEGETLADFALMVTRISGKEFNIGEIQTKCDTNIKEKMANMLKKISITLDAENKTAYIGSIFEAALNAVKEREVNAGNDEPTFKAYEIADTIAALNTPIERKALPDAKNYTTVDGENIFVKMADPTLTSNLLEGKVTINANILGRNLGYVVKDQAIGNIQTELSIQGASVFQVAMINSSDATGLQASLAAANWGTDKSFAVVSLQIPREGIDGYNSTLLPDNLYITAILDLATADTQILYNNLTSSEKEVLAKLANNANAFSKESQVKEKILDMTIFSIALTDLGSTGTANVKLRDVIEKEMATFASSTYDYYEVYDGSSVTLPCGEYRVNKTMLISDLALMVVAP